MGWDCFISYASGDLVLAEELHRQLSAAGLRVWFDKSRLEPGCNWYAQIKDGADAARIILPVLTPRWRQSNWTKFETYAGESVNRAALPAGHPQIAGAMNNLAVLLKDQRKLGEAERLHREALHLRRNALPAGHPKIAESLNNLAILLEAQNRLADAEPLYREAIEIRERAFGPENTATQQIKENLADLLERIGPEG